MAPLQREQQIPRRMLVASSLGMTIKGESRRASEGEALRYKSEKRELLLSSYLDLREALREPVR